MYKVAYSKVNKRFVAKVVKEDKNFDYIRYIFRKVLKRVQESKRSSRRNGTKRQRMLKRAPEERPSREEVIENSEKYRRIKL